MPPCMGCASAACSTSTPKPLIVPYDGEVMFDHPARLADLLAAGEIDVALVPGLRGIARNRIFQSLTGLPLRPEALSIRFSSHISAFCARFAPCPLTPLPALRIISCAACLRSFTASARNSSASGETFPGGDRGMLLIGNHAICFRELPRRNVITLTLERNGWPKPVCHSFTQYGRFARKFPNLQRGRSPPGHQIRRPPAGPRDRPAPERFRSCVCRALPDQIHQIRTWDRGKGWHDRIPRAFAEAPPPSSVRGSSPLCVGRALRPNSAFSLR